MAALQRLPYKSLTRKTFRSEVYCPSYRDVRFMVCPSYRDLTVELKKYYGSKLPLKKIKAKYEIKKKRNKKKLK